MYGFNFLYAYLFTYLLIPHLLRNVVVACRKSFICRGWSNPVTSAGRGQCKVGVSYLGEMLSVDGDAEARIRIGWNKFRQLANQ